MGPDRFNFCVVRGLAYNRDGNLWIATFAEGLARYSLTENTFTFFKSHPTSQNSITNNTILRVFEDNAGILWIGSWGGYVCKLDLYASHVFNLENDLLNLLNNISYLLQEPDGIIWASSYNEDLVEISPDRKGYRVYGVPRLSNILINTLSRTKDGTIWVGSCNGLNKISPDRARVSVINLPNAVKDKLSNSISSLYVDNDDNVWIGADEGKVHIYDYKHNHFETYEGTITPVY